MKAFQLVVFFVIFSHIAIAQVINHEQYKEVDIDSILNLQIKVPSKGYTIVKVKFITVYLNETGMMGGISRRRFSILTKEHPEIKFQFDKNPGAAKFSTPDTTLYLPLTKGLWVKITKYDKFVKPRVLVFADMIVSLDKEIKYRDFLVRDVHLYHD